MRKFEYITRLAQCYWGDNKSETLQEWLNFAGQERWELVAVKENLYFFKREIVE